MDGDLKGAAYGRARADAADAWLAELFDVAVQGAPRGLVRSGLALVALGGYGRRELCPCSDIDVMLLYGSTRDRQGLRSMAEKIWYPLWDAGAKLGHAVRTPKEALALAAGDLETATSLLDLRLVAGDAEVAAEVAQRAAGQWRSRSASWLKALAQSVVERHLKAGEVAYLLEPDLKEGRGGLRDVHALRWAQAAEHVVDTDDLAVVEAAYDVLLGARVELHRSSGRPNDRLLLQDQDAVAEGTGDADADVLMRRVAEAARAISWTSDLTWERVVATLSGPRRRGPERVESLGRGLLRRDDTVDLAADADVAGDATLTLRAAAAAATAGIRMSRQALAELSAHAPGLPDPWPLEARRALLELLSAGPPAIDVIEAVDHFSLLVRMVPEWAEVRSRPQRNALHLFTVDRHLCEAAVEAAALAPRVQRGDLLVLGAWLHDLGKGFCDLVPSGDHSDAGEVVVARLARRMGFDSADVDVLVKLVRHHLLLSKVATRRDVDDPATASAVAEEVGDLGTLELLHALTEADSQATGPAAWSPWKADLVSHLVHRVEALMTQGRATPGRDESWSRVRPLTEAHQRLVAQVAETAMPAIAPDGEVVMVAGPDRPGLFCRVAGVLTLHGLDVLSARGWSSAEGVAVDELRVHSVLDLEPDWDRVSGDLVRALTGRLALEAALVERTRSYPRRPTTAASAAPRITADNSASEAATVVEVRAPDRTGTLYRITRAMAELQLDIRYATVTTTGDELVDSFYLVDNQGAKLDAEQLTALEREVLLELGRVG